MSKLNLGIVGVGKIARDQHLPVLANSPDFRLVAAASRNAGVEGVASYASLEAMLDGEPAIHAVSLCTPPAVRAADARLALSRGIHVLLEKPPTANLSEARDLFARATNARLCASWHSRHAAAVASARAWLSGKQIQAAAITWKEDIRRWHPGQDWILDVGGMGVFDPGINALSILTHILPHAVTLTTADLHVPSNRQCPIAADLRLDHAGAAIAAHFDFREQGPQIWDINIQCAQGQLLLTDGGARWSVDQAPQVTPAADRHHEYVGVYAAFAACIRDQRSDCDLRPLELAADAFMNGRRHLVSPFSF